MGLFKSKIREVKVTDTTNLRHNYRAIFFDNVDTKGLKCCSCRKPLNTFSDVRVYQDKRKDGIYLIAKCEQCMFIANSKALKE